MGNLIYPKELGNIVKEYNCIPRLIKKVDEIKRSSKYFCQENSNEPFKIEEVIEVNNQIYYQIKLISSYKQAVIPYEEKFTYYELFPDRSNIKQLKNIINNGKPYYGSEIKYWFYINNIDLDCEKYNEFKDIITESGMTISDKKIYFLKASYVNSKDIFIKCRAVQAKRI